MPYPADGLFPPRIRALAVLAGRGNPCYDSRMNENARDAASGMQDGDKSTGSLIRLTKLLAEYFYAVTLYDDRIEIETEITSADKETEIVEINSGGVFPVEEGSEAAKEIAENPDLVKDETQVEKTVYRLAETEIVMSDVKDLILIFVNRSFIHAVPKRCLGTDEMLAFKAYFEEKGLI